MEWARNEKNKPLEGIKPTKMNINLEKHDVGLILDALESYQQDIEHGKKNGNAYVWTEEEVGNLVNYLNNTFEETMTKINMTIEIEAVLPEDVSVEEFMDFLSVQSYDSVKINILNSDILSVEKTND
jgi:hypothetical protein